MSYQDQKKKRGSENKRERTDSPKVKKYQAKVKNTLTRANSRPLQPVLESNFQRGVQPNSQQARESKVLTKNSSRSWVNFEDTQRTLQQDAGQKSRRNYNCHRSNQNKLRANAKFSEHQEQKPMKPPQPEQQFRKPEQEEAQSKQDRNLQERQNIRPWRYTEDFGHRLPGHHYLITGHQLNQRQCSFRIKTARLTQEQHREDISCLMDWFEEREARYDISTQKEKAFVLLETIVDEYFCSFHQGLTNNGQPIYKLLKFGSSYLKTDDFESDIDSILCTFAQIEASTNNSKANPKLFQILDHDNGSFFDIFFGYLQKKQSSGLITDLQKVEEALVPLIKLKINNIDIDLLLCSKASSASDLTDPLDTTSKKSLNSIQGYECTRVLEQIASSFQIPKSKINGKMENTGLYIFRNVTKLIKYFCKCKRIYGANLCYLNGMTIQIMTLYVMELAYQEDNPEKQLLKWSQRELAMLKFQHAKAQIQHIFEKFFSVFQALLDKQLRSGLERPQPLILNHIKKKNDSQDQMAKFFFDEQLQNQINLNFCDDGGLERLDVLTPVFPPKNSSANIQGSSFYAVMNEIKKADQLLRCKNNGLLQNIMHTSGTSSDSFYSKLFSPQPISMISEHKYFLKISVTSTDSIFNSFFQSRIKNLRERIENSYISEMNEQKDYLKEQQQLQEQKSYLSARRKQEQMEMRRQLRSGQFSISDQEPQLFDVDGAAFGMLNTFCSSTFGDSTGGTDRYENECCDAGSSSTTKLQQVNPEESYIAEKQGPIITGDQLIESISPVLIQKVSDHLFYISMPFTTASSWHQQNILRVIAQFQQDSIFRTNQEYLGKDNLKFQIVSSNVPDLDDS